jgi:hypothetical protein
VFVAVAWTIGTVLFFVLQVVVPMRTSPQLLKSKLSPEALQSLEDKLRALDAFLSDYLHRRRGRRPAANADGGAMPTAKRQRLEDAQQAELKR